jgi:CrcB protein
MINSLLIVGIGGAAGSMIRFLAQRFLNLSFPFGTLLVNLSGCFLIGIFWALLTRNNLSESMRLLWITGFCGGFTTFSAFTAEGNQMMMEGRWLLFFIYLTVSIAGGFFVTFLGFKIFHI